MRLCLSLREVNIYFFSFITSSIDEPPYEKTEHRFGEITKNWTRNMYSLHEEFLRLQHFLSKNGHNRWHCEPKTSRKNPIDRILELKVPLDEWMHAKNSNSSITNWWACTEIIGMSLFMASTVRNFFYLHVQRIFFPKPCQNFQSLCPNFTKFSSRNFSIKIRPRNSPIWREKIRCLEFFSLQLHILKLVHAFLKLRKFRAVSQ